MLPGNSHSYKCVLVVLGIFAALLGNAQGFGIKGTTELIRGPFFAQPAPSDTALQAGKLAEDLGRRLNWKNREQAANRSASLYMSPATMKIANVTVSWEPKAAEEIRKIQKIKNNPNRPFTVGVVGIPGSGKSTSCDILASMLPGSIVMPMDGYHYSMEELSSMPNPVDAIYRRGAPDTFNPTALRRDLERIVYGNESSVSIPGFSHAKGDPEQNQHTFDREQHNIVILEGIYLMHDQDGWEHIKSYLDWTIYIAADVDICIGRLKERNKCIPGYTPEEIDIRCDAVDRVNAEIVEKSRRYASQEVKSGTA